MTSESTFNPAYRIARCGQQDNHEPHVMEHGPDQPRNCPGTGPTVIDLLPAADHHARLAAGTDVECPICHGTGNYFSEEAGSEGGEMVACVTCRGSGRLAAGTEEG